MVRTPSAIVLLICAVVAACAAPWSTSALAQVVSVPQALGSRWTLDIRPGELRLYIDDESGQPYWYFTYMVINRSGNDRMWAPRLDLLTDDGRVQPSGRDVPGRVVRDIITMLGSDLIEDQNQIIGDLLQGVEHAKEGVVVWPAPNLQVTEMTIFISGLSGETELVVDPLSGEDVVLRRTHWLRYALPGEALPMRSTPVRLAQRGWVMR